MQTNLHQHLSRCQKPPKGYHKCADGFNQNLSETWRQLQHLPWQKKAYEAVNKDNHELPPYVDTCIQPMENYNNRDINQTPIIMPNERLIYWEQKRPLLQGLPDIYKMDCNND